MNSWVAESPPNYALDKQGLLYALAGRARRETVGLGKNRTFLSFLFQTTQTFDAATLNTLYPGGKADYLAKFNKALESAVKAGFIPSADVPEIKGSPPRTILADKTKRDVSGIMNTCK